MFCKLFLMSVLLAGVHSRYLLIEQPSYYIAQYEEEPLVAARVRRQAGVVTVNSDGTSSSAVKIPITGNENHKFSTIGGIDLDKTQKLSSSTIGLAYDNVNRHGASITNSKVPGFGQKFTAATKLNLFHNDEHDVSANAFATRNLPTVPQLRNFNTFGGGVDYMFKDKIGASVSAAHSDFINRNDYSFGGKLNLIKTPTTSFDFNAGWKKFDMPEYVIYDMMKVWLGTQYRIFIL